MDKEEIISKLRESLERDFGDYGRTQYVIEKLEKDRPLPNSDHIYIERMIKLCEPIIVEAKPAPIVDIILPEDLIKCHHCDVQIKLDERSVRKNNFWFHQQCFATIPVVKTQEPIPIVEKPPKIIKEPVIIQPRPTNSQMSYSAGLLASLTGTTYFLAGEVIATVVGVCGTALYFATFKSNKTPKKKSDIAIVKTGIPGFDSTLSMGLKRNSSVVVSGPPGSGKTIFGLQFIYSGAKEFDEPGVFISLSQSTDEIKSDCKSFGWDIEDLISKEKILMIDLRPFKIKDEVIGKDESLYRGEQIPFEHLTKFILNSIKKLMRRGL